VHQTLPGYSSGLRGSALILTAEKELKKLKPKTVFSSKWYSSTQACWCSKPVIPPHGRQRQENHKFKASMGYIDSETVS
jgi:hypothetical protein